jgi:hypothetical protein
MQFLVEGTDGLMFRPLLHLYAPGFHVESCQA